MEISNYTNDALELLKELIAIPSVSREEKNAADKLAEYLNRWNLPFGREGNNLWVGCQDWDNNRPTVMLNGFAPDLSHHAPSSAQLQYPLGGICRRRGVRC